MDLDRTYIAIGVFVLLVVLGGIVLLWPLSSPSDELPVVDAGYDSPHQVTGERDVNQRIELQYYFEQEQVFITDRLLYDADTHRAYNTFGGDERDNSSVAFNKEQKIAFYIEPYPSNDSKVRVYSAYFDIEQDAETRQELLNQASNESGRTIVYADNNTTRYDYEVHNMSAIEAVREETFAQTRLEALAFTNGRTELTGGFAPTLVTPNYTKTGTRVVNGETYDVYEPRPHWVDGSSNVTISAYNTSGEVLYGDSPPHYRRIDISYDIVRGNTRLALLEHSLLEDRRIGVDIMQERTVGDNTVTSEDVPCPSWTAKVGPNPTCSKEG